MITGDSYIGSNRQHRLSDQVSANTRQFTAKDPARQGRRDRPLRSDRSRRKATVREHGPRSQDNPPPARNRSEDRDFPPQRRGAARVRPACRRRDLDGRCAADAGVVARLAGTGRAGARRRCRSAAVCGAGAGMADIIASGVVPVGRLTEIFRQAAESRIVVNAHRINQGLMPDFTLVERGDFYFVDAADAEEGVRKLLAIVQNRIPERFGLDPIRDIQMLCPMNRGGLGARSLNIELQNALKPAGEIRIERFGWTFCPGDKVMQVENDYDKDVYNGDLGVVSRIDMEEGELHVDFDGREGHLRVWRTR